MTGLIRADSQRCSTQKKDESPRAVEPEILRPAKQSAGSQDDKTVEIVEVEVQNTGTRLCFFWYILRSTVRSTSARSVPVT